jgi:hypothetical protein
MASLALNEMAIGIAMGMGVVGLLALGIWCENQRSWSRRRLDDMRRSLCEMEGSDARSDPGEESERQRHMAGLRRALGRS